MVVFYVVCCRWQMPDFRLWDTHQDIKWRTYRRKKGMIHVIHANGLWNDCDNVIIEIVYYTYLCCLNKCYNYHSDEEIENFLEATLSELDSRGVTIFCCVFSSGIRNTSSSEDTCAEFLCGRCGNLSLIFILLITLFMDLPLNTCSIKINLKMDIHLIIGDCTMVVLY